MDIESIGFAIQTTVVGMLIVFGFLSFLAGAMVLLSRLFKDSETASGGSMSLDASDTTQTITRSGSSGTSSNTDNSQIAGVVVAAAAAFIEHEQRSSEASAAQWSAIATHNHRPNG